MDKKGLSDFEKGVIEWVGIDAPLGPSDKAFALLQAYEFHRIADALEEIARKMKSGQHIIGGDL